ncbi:hypothetical protein [Taibaiella helva]|uniref:hypothetical protein n=1 Tax=Taibaiella helva TaxID=2301235 RepID=UPI000E592143|nr:hypothetical protein [Taibaiella helva]
MFYKEILLLHKPYTLHSLTREIQRQSGITFSYNAARINPAQKVGISKRLDRITVKELLGLLGKKTGVGYKIVNQSHIIYTPATAGRKPKAKKDHTGKRMGVAQSQKPAPASRAGVQPPAVPEPEALQSLVIVGDSSLAMSYYLSGGSGSGGAYGGNIAPKYPETTQAEEEDDDEEAMYGTDRKTRRQQGKGGFYTPLGQSATVRFIKQSVLVSGGLSADDLYYINPTLRIGFSFLHGTIAYSTGSFAHWRYGLGSALNIGDRWNLRLEVNSGGPLQSPYNIRVFDTTRIPIDSGQVQLVINERNTPLLVQSRLTRFVLGAEWNVTGNFYLGGALILNRLHTTYSSNGNAIALRDILPVGIDADKKYRTIDPPYLLGNSYSANSTSNTKIWLGIQLSLIYRIRFFDQ